MTDKRDTPRQHPADTVGDNLGEGGEADIKPDLEINDGGLDGPTKPDTTLSQS